MAFMDNMPRLCGDDDNIWVGLRLNEAQRAKMSLLLRGNGDEERIHQLDAAINKTFADGGNSLIQRYFDCVERLIIESGADESVVDVVRYARDVAVQRRHGSLVEREEGDLLLDGLDDYSAMISPLLWAVDNWMRMAFLPQNFAFQIPQAIVTHSCAISPSYGAYGTAFGNNIPVNKVRTGQHRCAREWRIAESDCSKGAIAIADAEFFACVPQAMLDVMQVRALFGRQGEDGWPGLRNLAVGNGKFGCVGIGRLGVGKARERANEEFGRVNGIGHQSDDVFIICGWQDEPKMSGGSGLATFAPRVGDEAFSDRMQGFMVARRRFRLGVSSLPSLAIIREEDGAGYMARCKMSFGFAMRTTEK